MTIQQTVVRSSLPSSNLTGDRAVISPSTAIGGSVIVSESALPTGAATAAAQATLLTELQLKANLTETQPVSITGIDGFISTANSTTATLAGGGVFTGTAEDTKNYGMILISVKASHASAADGLNVEFSPDGTNWDYSDVFTIAAATGKTFTLQTVARYMRIVYTNGATQQTYFRLQTQFKPVYVKPSSHRVADNISGQDDSELVKAVLAAETPGGVFHPINATAAGNLKVGIEEIEPAATVGYYQHVAEGAVTGAMGVNKFGSAPNGIQTTATDIWDRADATPTQQIWLAPTAARIHAIASSSDTDGKTGSPTSAGARTIRLYGLATWGTAESSEVVTLDGTTAVNTVGSYVIIHRMKVLTSGASGPNVGTITATAATDGTVTAAILPGNGQTEMAIYGIPSTKTAYILRWGCSLDKTVAASTSADFRLLVNESPDVITTVFLRKDDISLQTGATTQFDRHYPMPYKIPGPAIIKVSAIGSSADIDGESGFCLLVK